MREARDSRASSTWLDRAIGWFSPEAGASRSAWREIGNQVGAYYRGATRSRLDDPGANSVSADQMSEMEREDLVERNREMERNYSSYEGAIGQCVVNVIGPQGLTVQARTEDEGFNSEVEAAWIEWCRVCDVRRMFTMSGLQELWFRSHLRDGDVGVILLGSGDLQSIESHRIVTPGGQRVDGSIVEGVELNMSNGRPTAFHISKSDGFVKLADTTRIPARDFVFFPHVTRLSQTRGLPAITKPWLFEQYDRYIEAVVVAARISACFGLILKRKGGGVPTGLPSTTDASGRTRKDFKLEPGLAKYIDTDEDITQLQPAQPGAQFGELRSAIKRDIGLPLGMPLELTDLDFSKTNYSSARASLLAAYRTFMRHQERFANMVMRRIYQWRVSKWVKDGTFSRAPETFWAHEWVMPRWPWVDPLKEIQANLLGMDAGITTLAEVSASQGKDWEATVAQRKREIDALDAAGIPQLHSSMTRDAGAEAEPPPAGGTEDE